MSVQARPGESFEELYRRFKRGIEGSGLLREYRSKQRFIPAHEERCTKIRSAKRKLRRAEAKRPVSARCRSRVCPAVPRCPTAPR